MSSRRVTAEFLRSCFPPKYLMNETTTGNGDGSGAEAAVSAGVAEPPREKLTKKALTADHPTWCPGCGDFAVLASFYKVLEKRNLAQEKIVTLAGIGCSSRFPYFVNGHGAHLHSRPGRPARVRY